MNREEAWQLMRACPDYFYDEEEGPTEFILMNDIWGWAWADDITLNDDNICRVAELYHIYGSCGLLYYCIETKRYTKSEFTDINRMIQFVQNEERIIAEIPEGNKRVYEKEEYIINGEIK